MVGDQYCCEIEKLTSESDDTRIVSIKMNNDQGFSNTDIKVIKITRQRMTFIPIGFAAFMPNTFEFHILSSGVAYVEKSNFKGLENLKTLTLDRNNIEELPENVFSDLGKLEFLSLEENRIKELPPMVFYGLQSLNYLILRENELTRLPINVFGTCQKLSRLDLKNNNLKSVDVGTFANLPALYTLNLAENDCIDSDLYFSSSDKNETFNLLAINCNSDRDEMALALRECTSSFFKKRNQLLALMQENALLKREN
jgi:Leucine-rich repeat (LRR) protein